eukprot:3519463-Amphidinium_carterae.1
MGKPSGSQRASTSGALPAAPKQVRVRSSREELVAVAIGDSTNGSEEDLRSQTSRARAEKARRKRERKQRRKADSPDAMLDALLHAQSPEGSVLALQCSSPTASHAATEVATVCSNRGGFSQLPGR